MRELMNVTRALSDESRVRILGALRGGELCVCQIVMLLGLAPSTVSKHLLLLRMAGLIEPRRDGRWIYYSLGGSAAPDSAKTALAWLLDELADDSEAQKDQQRLAEIAQMDPETLCRVMAEDNAAARVEQTAVRR